MIKDVIIHKGAPIPFLRVAADPMLTRQKQWLLALFRRVFELRADPLNKRMLALEIQEELLERIGRAERLMRQIRTDNKLIKKTLAEGSANRDAARKAKAEHVAGEERIEQQRTLISVLRSIGDSIAFIYGDRWDLKQMVMKEEPGFVTGKQGTRLERKILRKAFEIGATVVMNDLTHTLRHGDITVFRPDLWPEGGSPFLLIEAKSGRGKSHARTARQMAAIEQVFDYLRTDKREVERGQWQRVSLKEAPQYHFEKATCMMTALPHGGCLLEQVEPGLHYALIDCAAKTGDYEPIFQKLLADGPRFFVLNVNDMKKDQFGYYPFPLCIQEPEALFRFYNGEFVMFVFIDIERVNVALAPKGLKVTPTGGNEYPWQVSSLGTDLGAESGESYVGFHPIGRLAAEFLRLDWVLDNIVAGPALDAFAKFKEQKCSTVGLDS